LPEDRDLALVVDSDQATSDTDQTLADADQTASDEDEAASDVDTVDADDDQRASDRDQVTADQEHAADRHPASDAEYEQSRGERRAASFDRAQNQLRRGATGRGRDATANRRDGTAAARDHLSAARDARSSGTDRGSVNERELRRQLDELREAAALERAAAAADRARAAEFRARAARERARLEAELRSAHIDQLTGAFRREMGDLALEHGIDRARRSDGRFVVAYVDVDRLKAVNDVEGHAAGDAILRVVARSIRARLRSFDPVVRYGGDEFVCGLGGTDVDEAERRFELIEEAIRRQTGASISVGFAAVQPDEPAAHLVERADRAMLLIKAAHHGVEERPS
jgi:diguanylate cyclase (GGDEF)-like protein